MDVLSIDFETYYTSELSVKRMAPSAYARALHPEKDIYWINLYGTGARVWGGHPLDMTERELGWIAHADRLLSHNASFDQAIWGEMARFFQFGPELTTALYPKWDCTSDMASCLGAPRSLSGACATLLPGGVEISKDVRAAMKGRRYAELNHDEQRAFREYARQDGAKCLELETTHGKRWSDKERWLSQSTRELTRRGIGVDLEKANLGLLAARALQEAAALEMPWNGRAKAGSRNAFMEACDAAGVPRPLTTDKKSPHWNEWLEAYGGLLPWATAIGKWRAAGRLIPIFETLLRSTREDGRYPVALMYYGGHTGRWSGTGGLNFQNLNKSAMAGVDLRSTLRADPGKKLIIADFSAIEALVSLWLCGEVEVIKMVERGMNLYEAFARTRGLWAGRDRLKESDPELYQRVKIQVLGLQYGMGAIRYAELWRAQTGKALDTREAALVVERFRASMPKLTEAWGIMETNLRRAIHSAEFRVPRPGGEQLTYREIRAGDVVNKDGNVRHTLFAKTLRGGQLAESAWWGGSLWENYVQSTARDLLGELLIDLDDAGIPVVLHCHDEVVVEVDEKDAKNACIWLERWTPANAGWAEGLPARLEVIGGEGKDYYVK